jgi:archaellum biogenesis protein FlaJ (TadC family)
MNKKILALFFLLIALASILTTYIYLKQKSTEEKEFNNNIKTIDDKTLTDEINASFIEEDYETEIGEMI